MTQENIFSYLEIFLGDALYMLPLYDISRVFEVPKVHALATVCSDIIGIGHENGRLMTFLDLEVLINIEVAKRKPRLYAKVAPKKWAFNLLHEYPNLAFCVTAFGATCRLETPYDTPLDMALLLKKVQEITFLNASNF